MLSDLPNTAQRLLFLSCQLAPVQSKQEELVTLALAVENWKELTEAARKERLAGLLYASLARSGALNRIKPEQTKILKWEYERTAAENLGRIREMIRIREKSRRAAIPFVLLKGMALLATTYRDIGLRKMDDMDLWVPPKEIGRFSELLESIGFLQDDLYPSTFRRGRVVVDLHTDPLGADRIRFRRFLLRTKASFLFKRAEPVSMMGSVFRCPTDFDQLVLLSAHALKHGLHRLVWMADIVNLVDRWESGDWNSFTKSCRKTGGERMVGSVLYAMEMLCEKKVFPTRTAGRLKNRQSLADQRLLHIRKKKSSLPFWAAAWLMRPEGGLLQSAGYLGETLFPRPVVLRQSFPGFFRLPAVILYMLRILQMMAWTVPGIRIPPSGKES